MGTASCVAVGTAVLGFAPLGALAQDDVDEIENVDDIDNATPDDSDVIVVTGVRSSLKSAQDIKRNADTIVDSITATDIGSFPDKSVAEALQRVAGVTVSRFAASGDTAHFSAEPSGVIVRGLQQVRSEFNGRDSFSANSSRGLSFGDVSPELMGGVDTYKNQMAELIEGGIAGTVNLRTRTPFDQPGQLISISGSANYNDLAESVTPEVSGLYSNRFETSIGEFGILANVAYSKVNTRTEGVQLYRMWLAEDVFQDGLTYLPERHILRDNEYDRERTGVALAGQWQDNDRKWLATLQYNRSEYQNAWEEYVLEAAYGADISYSRALDYTVTPGEAIARYDTIPQALLGTNLTFDEDGFLQTGTLVGDNTSWTGNPDPNAGDWTGYFALLDSGEPLFTQCYNWQGCYGQYSTDRGENPVSPLSQRGARFGTRTRSNNNKNVTQDIGFNLKYAPTDRLRFNFDAQWIDASVDNYDIEIAFETYAQQAVDYTGDLPVLTLETPPNMGVTNGYLERPDSYRYQYVMDHIEESTGEEYAFRGDAEYDIDNGWLSSIKVGTRYANRQQDIQNSAYNWQSMGAATWQARGHIYNINRFDPPADFGNYAARRPLPDGSTVDGPPGINFNGYPDTLDRRLWDGGFFGGGLLNGANAFMFFDMDVAQDKEQLAGALGASALGFDIAGAGWDPICSNTGDRIDEVAGTCYTPAELANVEEETYAGYAQLNFGGSEAQLFGVPFSGNIGVRYVHTINSSSGGIDLPQLGNDLFQDLDLSGTIEPDERAVDNVICVPNPPREVTGPDGEPTGEVLPPEIPFSNGCYLSEDDIRFSLGGSSLTTAEAKHDHWLPSANIKFDLTDEFILRFAASRAMSRPDFGQLRNYASIGVSLPSNEGDPSYITDENGEIIGIDPIYTASGQNPYLEPVTADQFDVSFEWYFSDVGSFTLAGFYKKFHDYIQTDRYNREVTVNGITRTVDTRGPINGDGASIKGFEVAYQTFFDFLPTPLDGFGVQANYSYIDNSGIQNTQPAATAGEGTEQFSGGTYETGALEGLSEHAYNLVGLYEKGPFAARLAYNWRSEYLVTVVDCCVAYPVWNDDQGLLDGSLRYRLNDNFELSLSAQNLLNTKTKTRQQVTDLSEGALLLPTGYFQNDRRYTLGLRTKF